MSVRERMRPRSTTGAVTSAARLPWWAVVLPATAFFALLMVTVNPSQAHAAGGTDALARLAHAIQLLLLP
ncbi:hypothetical protein [Streptomyces fuscigenes]|uniref:hypothetical protein n=1 Tax=Streptomyces fuscigenes TaxID=1528880 RepID=UPI001F2AFACB|nr:hypothetical protein [Streptomyces fuscigenes]MCF3964843.1 hypothetical protein [Streptomyces fuscigenes]